MEQLHKNANELFIQKKYKSAIKIYNNLINNNYKLSIIYSNKAACFMKLKKYKKSLMYSLYSVEHNLNNSIAWGRVGYSYKGLNMLAEALEAFDIAHKLNKNNENYSKEIIFLNELINSKINIKNVFKLLFNNKTLYNKLKNIKNVISNNNLSINQISNNNEINKILNNNEINQILNDLLNN
jgi:tetratricopeptide (TPR) repeat protein